MPSSDNQVVPLRVDMIAFSCHVVSVQDLSQRPRKERVASQYCCLSQTDVSSPEEDIPNRERNSER